MKTRFLLSLLLGFSLTLGNAAEPDKEEIPEPFRTLIPLAQEHVADFPEIPVGTKQGEHTFSTIRLDDDKVIRVGEARFACVRFTTPTGGSLDMVWAFSVPASWRTWYILPAKGVMQGFADWLGADRLYDGMPATADAPACLQTLPAARLKPDTTYILWFQQQKPSVGPVNLTAAIGFFPTPSGGQWDADAIDAALGLKTAPARQQADYLDSRSLRAVLDTRFFTSSEGEGYVRNVLLARRQLRFFKDGRFIALKTQVPPCTSQPLFADVRAAWGEPDFVLSSAEQKFFGDEDSARPTTYYYDYLGFQVQEAAGGARIVNVIAQGASAASLRPQQGGLTWSDSAMPEVPLRIFYRDKKEIARIAHWGEGNASLLSGSLPTETFSLIDPDGEREELKGLGEGKWDYRALYADGKLARTATLEKHIYEGVLRDFYPDGKPRAEVPYTHGEIDGTVRQWNADGEVQEVKYEGGHAVR